MVKIEEIASTVLLLDLDEVLVDFVGGACRVHGIAKEQLYHQHANGRWDMSKAVGQCLGADDFNLDTFWEPIHVQGADFWLGLEKLPWFDDLVDYADMFLDWYIVTSPSRHHGSIEGKRRWMQREFGHAFDQYVITPHKALLARPKTVLIDDRSSNIDSFNHGGGLGYVFPTKHNRWFDYAEDPLTFLERFLPGIKG